MAFKKYSVTAIVLVTILADFCLSFYLSIAADMTLDHSLMGFQNYTNLTNGTNTSQSKNGHVTLGSAFEALRLFSPPTASEYFSTHSYNFLACQLDFIVVSFLRVSVLLGFLVVLYVVRDGQKAMRWVNNGQTPIICVYLCTLAYSPIKLLALNEIYPTLHNVTWFWYVFAANIAFSLIEVYVGVCVLPRCEVTPRPSSLATSEDMIGPPPGEPRVPKIVSPASKQEVKGQQMGLGGSAGDLDESEPLVEDSSNSYSSTGFGRSSKKDKVKFYAETANGKTNKLCQSRKSSAASRRMSDDSIDSKLLMQKQMEAAEVERKKMEKEAEMNRTASSSLMIRILKYCKDEWLLYTLGFVFLIGYSSAKVFIPLFTGQVVADVLVYKSAERLSKSVFIMICIGLVSSVLSGLRAGCFMYAIAKVNMKIRSQLFLSLVSQEIGFFDVTKTGEITSRLTSDCQVMSDAVATNLNLFLRSLIMLIGSVIMMVILSWRLTLLIFIVLPIIVVVSNVYGTYYEKLSQYGQDALARSNEVAEEVLSTMRTVRSFANEIGESKRYDFKLLDVLKIGKRKSIAFMGYTWISELADLVILGCLVWYGGHLVLTGRMNSEHLISYFLYQLVVADCLISMGTVYTGLMNAVGASRKVFEFIDRKPKIIYDGTLQTGQFKGRIEFKNVTFAYPSRPKLTVLKNINFTIEPGECCALVGPSGGGKSSCIGLIEHFYEPLAGQILIDNIPVGKFDHGFFHRKVSLVGQEPVLYAKSIKDNIVYGLKEGEIPDEEILLSAKLANAHRFIVNLNNGYATDVGEKGLQLSGGQKQRVAIARAIVRKPAILLLDEATSALDAESEHLVQKALNENLQGYTILLIAHRLSTVQRANKIIVIENGTVVQMGRHENLIKEDGLYRNLVHRQMLGEKRGSTSSDA